MNITEEQALDALCIWEEVLEAYRQGDKTLYEWICAPEGAWQGRTHALLLAPLLTDAWRHVEKAFDMDFDWEFVPAALPLFAERPFVEVMNDPKSAYYVARRIIKKRRIAEDPQLALEF